MLAGWRQTGIVDAYPRRRMPGIYVALQRRAGIHARPVFPVPCVNRDTPQYVRCNYFHLRIRLA
jgi:hypothetical protein